MKVKLEQELQVRQPLARIAESANPVLEEAVGRAAERITATWGFRSDERGRPLIRLTISDWTGEGSAEFAPEELQPPAKARRKFFRLWGDVLQAASLRIGDALEHYLTGDQTN